MINHSFNLGYVNCISHKFMCLHEPKFANIASCPDISQALPMLCPDHKPSAGSSVVQARFQNNDLNATHEGSYQFYSECKTKPDNICQI